MAELRSFRKRKVFLALKQDLGKVYLFPEFALSTCKSFNRHLCFFVFVFVFVFLFFFFGRLSKLPLWPRNGWTIPWIWPERPRIS